MENLPFFDEIKLHVKANFNSFYVENYEWEKFQAGLLKQNFDKDIFFFNDAQGLFRVSGNERISEDETDISEVVSNIPQNAMYVFDHIHSYFEDPQVITRFRVAIRELRAKKSVIIIFSPLLNIPKELEKDLTIIEYPLPELGNITKMTARLLKTLVRQDSFTDDIPKSLLGLTMKEVENSIRKTALRYGKITSEEIPYLIYEKEQIIKKSGYLEYFHPKENLDSIGGLDNLKEWLKIRSKAFSEKAQEFGLSYPKGVLLLGIPGTGKSLSAKAVSNSWKFPLLRLDFGKIFGGLVGESESNIRQTIKIAESLSPSILWIDEIEKGLGASSGGVNDGGTSTRVFGTFLTWLQEKESEVFVLATANDISSLPPELLRKGRFDEIFFVDLPTFEERKQILEIHIKRRKQNPKLIDVDEVANFTKGFSGAELDELVHEALFNIYDPLSKEKNILKTRDLIEVAEKVFPLSRTMEERIRTLRKWSKNRTKSASKYEPEDIEKFSGVRLKNEVFENPFMDFE
ncbi:AAA+ family ATPase [Thiovulum sp. ES]|nr:AAA+ family ATPase [Thiovulum sp. ES]